MTLLGLAVFALVAADHAPPSVSPNNAELASAITSFTGTPVAAGDLRRIICTGIDEEPTEYACQWQQRRGTRWQRFSGYLAIDGMNWLLIDEPTRRR